MGGALEDTWPKLDISAPDTSPQSPMARPPAAAALQASGPGSVPPWGLGIRISSFPDTEDRRPQWPHSGHCLSTGDTFGPSYEPLQWLTPDQELSQSGDLLEKAILTGRQLVQGPPNVEPHGDMT